MLQQYHTKLKGTLALTDSYLTEKALQKEKGLYKFIWVRNGSITVEIDHQEMTLTKDEVISLTHLQHLEFKSIDGEYLTLLFNSNFYCIYGNDHEVSCSGFLFNGSSHLIRFTLNEKERKEFNIILSHEVVPYYVEVIQAELGALYIRHKLKEKLKDKEKQDKFIKNIID